MNRFNARLLALASFTLVSLVARKPALGADGSDSTQPLVIDNAAPQPASNAPGGSALPEQRFDAPPPAPAAGRTRPRAILEIDEHANATKTRNGVTTELTPEQFYKAVGRKDLAEALQERRKEKRGVVIGGAVLAGLGTALLIGDVAYAAGGFRSCNLPSAQSRCSAQYAINNQLAATLALVGLGGIVAGTGVLVGGLVGMHPDAGGEDERRDLLDEYNARAPRSEARTNAPDGMNATNEQEAPRDAAGTRQLALRSLATLSLAPLVSDQARGVTLRMAF